MYTLNELRSITNKCTRCELSRGRTNVVFGHGNPRADLMFIGEGPGFNEDKQGLPFVGAAGKLLTKAIEAIGLKREEVYIANIVKCRPPNNRNPKSGEIEKCLPFLRWQVKIIAPKIIVCLGSVSAKTIIDKDFKITKGRGQWIEKKGIKIIPTFHPAAILRDENKKRPFWEDFKKIQKEYMEIKNNN